MGAWEDGKSGGEKIEGGGSIRGSDREMGWDEWGSFEKVIEGDEDGGFYSRWNGRFR